MILSTFPSTLLYLARGNFERSLELVKEYELDAVDFTPAHFIDRTANELKALMNKKGVKNGGSHCVLPIASLNKEEHEKAVRDAEIFIRNIAAIGGTECMVVPGTAAVCTDTDKKPLYAENILQGLYPLVSLGKQLGVHINIENFSQPKTPFSAVEECVYLLDRVEGLTFCFDMGNFVYMDIDPLKAYDTLGKRSTAIHLKDVISSAEKIRENPVMSPSGRYIYPCDIGEGRVDVKELLKRFKRDGFRGPVTLELSATKGSYEQFDKVFRENISMLRELI